MTPPISRREARRSALTLLALLDVRPESAWSDASAPLRGVTEMMDGFFAASTPSSGAAFAVT